MPSLALATRPLHRPVAMLRPAKNTPTDDAAVALGRALAALRKRAGLSQAAAGEKSGITGQGWARYELGQGSTIHNPIRQAELTAAIGYTPADLARERQILAGGGSAAIADIRTWMDPQISEMIIRDRVQAGAWLMADDSNQDAPRKYPFARDPRFPHANQWLSEVVGDSVDRLGIFNNDLVHCIDVEDAGWALQSGAIVEVERLRFDGAERELSIKQVEVTPGRVLLWPRSSNPRWHDPLSMTDGTGDEDVVVRVRGLVVQSIRRY